MYANNATSLHQRLDRTYVAMLQSNLPLKLAKCAKTNNGQFLAVCIPHAPNPHDTLRWSIRNQGHNTLLENIHLPLSEWLNRMQMRAILLITAENGLMCYGSSRVTRVTKAKTGWITYGSYSVERHRPSISNRLSE